MIPARIPENEQARLEELRQYAVLDTAPEQAYDDITLLASTICETPIALVSLVDEDRQWFKSRVGLEATETPRDLAFCAHAIVGPDDLFVVPDASLDARFSDNPLVTGAPDIRFYAGAPLVTSSGAALGTLCVIDREPRELTEGQTEALRALTRQVMAQLELRRAYAILQDDTERLARYQEQLIAKSSELQSIYHTVSHELKTPLTAAREFISLLRDEVAGPITATQAEYLDTAQSCCDQLGGLLNNWLESVRSETGKLKLDREPSSLSDLVSEWARKYEVLATKGGLRLVTEIDPDVPDVWIDRRRIEQVMANLISNAIKFTEEGGTITVRCGSDAENVVISATDTGRGIHHSHLQHVLDPFYQAEDADATKRRGMGLGLYVCRIIVELHGGELSLESEPGVGTTVKLVIPIESDAGIKVDTTVDDTAEDCSVDGAPHGAGARRAAGLPERVQEVV